MHRVQHAETKVDGEFESRFARGCFDAVAVFKQQHAEAVKSSILQRKPILGFVHAEAAWSARSRSEEDVVVQNLLARDTFLLQKLEILHQVPDGKIRRIALAIVAVLFARLEGGDVRHRQLLAAIAAALKDGANQILMLPCETAK